MWWHEAVQQGHPFKSGVCYVERRQEPFVFPRCDVQVVCQAGDFCISNICSRTLQPRIVSKSQGLDLLDRSKKESRYKSAKNGTRFRSNFLTTSLSSAIVYAGSVGFVLRGSSLWSSSSSEYPTPDLSLSSVSPFSLSKSVCSFKGPMPGRLIFE